jgi:AbrB family looped-hinge helix DNA binding protein
MILREVIPRMPTTITSKGQVTIPKPIRDKLGVGPRDRVEFVLRDGEVVLRPVRRSVLSFRGFLRQEVGRRGVKRDAIREVVKRKVAERVARGE